jgi:hypothetical protein
MTVSLLLNASSPLSSPPSMAEPCYLGGRLYKERPLLRVLRQAQWSVRPLAEREGDHFPLT